MPDTLLALMLTALVMLLLFAWLPLLHQADAMSRNSRLMEEEDMPDLREDDVSPQLGRGVVSKT